MKANHIRTFSFLVLQTPLHNLRLAGVLSFLCTAAALLLPHGRQFFTGGAVTMSGILTLQLFRLRSVEEKPDPRDSDLTTLSISSR